MLLDIKKKKHNNEQIPEGEDVERKLEPYNSEKGIIYMEDVLNPKHALERALDPKLTKDAKVTKQTFSYDYFWKEIIASGLALTNTINENKVEVPENSEFLIVPPADPIAVLDPPPPAVPEPLLTRRGTPPSKHHVPAALTDMASKNRSAIFIHGKEFFFGEEKTICPIFSEDIFFYKLRPMVPSSQEPETTAKEDGKSALSKITSYEMHFFASVHITKAMLLRIEAGGRFRKEREFVRTAKDPCIEFLLREKGEYMIVLQDVFSEEKQGGAGDEDYATHRYLLKTETDTLYLAEFPYAF